VEPAADVGLADRMQARTRDLHARAERSGIVAQIIRGTVARADYVTYLRALLPVYRSLEAAFEAVRDDAVFGPLQAPALHRSAALVADIAALDGAGGPDHPAIAAGRRLAERIAALPSGKQPERLIAHAYTRYLGDLNGGRLLARRLADTASIGPDALRFYSFPQLQDASAYARIYRGAIDRAGAALAQVEPVVEEAAAAFALNIEISNAALEK
jgi:heme oxygenase